LIKLAAFSNNLFLNKTAAFNIHKKRKAPPLSMRNGVLIFNSWCLLLRVIKIRKNQSFKVCHLRLKNQQENKHRTMAKIFQRKRIRYSVRIYLIKAVLRQIRTYFSSLMYL